jgi:foldase protein PrsA
MKIPYRKVTILSLIIPVVLVIAVITLIFTHQLPLVNKILHGEEYVATVGGERITKVEYLYYLRTVVNKMESNAKALDENAKKEFWMSKIEGENVVNLAKKRALEEAQKLKIQLIKAKNAGINLDETTKENIAAQFESMKGNLDGEQKANQYMLDLYGVDFLQYRSIVEELAVVSQVVDKEKNGTKYKDEDLEKYYNENKDEFDSIVYYRVCFPKYTGRSHELLPKETLKKIEDYSEVVLKEARAGKGFDEIAAENKNIGNYLVDRGENEITVATAKITMGISKWLFSAKIGDVEVFNENASQNIEIIKKIRVSDTFNDSKEKVASKYLGTQYPQLLLKWSEEDKYKPVINTKVYDTVKIRDYIE